MIHQNRLFRPFLLAAWLCSVAASSSFAQGPEGSEPSGHHGGHHGPPPNPLFDALDTNHDGVISAEEMANASASLKSLLKDGATQLTREDLRPTPPAAQSAPKEEAAPGDDETAHPRPPAIRDHRPPQPPEAQAAPEPAADQPVPPGAGPLAHRGPQAGEGMHHHGPPPSPIFDALDTNHDGVLSEEEMANASAALKGLLKKGTTELRREDLRPAGPPEHRVH